MIQRIQTIWLALAAIFEALTFQFPFFTGDWKEDKINTAVDLNARTELSFSIIAAFIIAVALISIFLFRNRKLQQLFCGIGIGSSGAAVGLYAYETKDFFNGSFAVWAAMYVAVVIFFLLAARSVRSDEKLVRSMDRLR